MTLTSPGWTPARRYVTIGTEVGRTYRGTPLSEASPAGWTATLDTARPLVAEAQPEEACRRLPRKENGPR